MPMSSVASSTGPWWILRFLETSSANRMERYFSFRHAHVLAASIIVLIGIFFITFSIPIYGIKIGTGPGAGVFPFWIGLFVLFSGILYFWKAFQTSSSERFLALDRRDRAKFVQNALSIIGYIALMPHLGFSLTSFLLLFFHLYLIGRYRFLFSLLFSVATAAICGYVFEIWLYIPLPRGFIGW